MRRYKIRNFVLPVGEVMAWLGHVTRMDGGRMSRRILEWKPMGRRIRGRPRKRWIEDVEEDIQTMGIRG